MTIRDEVLAMTNEQLRVEIARELGWTYSPAGNYPAQMNPPNGDGFHVKDCPDWPNNIVSAWGLVEDLPYFRLEKDEAEDGLTYWRVTVGDLIINHQFHIEDSTAPLAISRTWLIFKKETEN